MSHKGITRLLFESLKRWHLETGKRQTDDYEKRMHSLKEEESRYMAKLLFQQTASLHMRVPETSVLHNPVTGGQQPLLEKQVSARRDLFLTSKNGSDSLTTTTNLVSQAHQHSQLAPKSNRSNQQPQRHESDEHEWNIEDDFQPLNITDNETIDENHHHHEKKTRPLYHEEYEDVENEEENDQCHDGRNLNLHTYFDHYQQLMQEQESQQQELSSNINPDQEQDQNMLSTILEASCEEATPMTSLIDVHYQKQQQSQFDSIQNQQSRKVNLEQIPKQQQ
ncbi:unnamed protein product, partial [Didymodactylos carnosus]